MRSGMGNSCCLTTLPKLGEEVEETVAIVYVSGGRTLEGSGWGVDLQGIDSERLYLLGKTANAAWGNRSSRERLPSPTLAPSARPRFAQQISDTFLVPYLLHMLPDDDVVEYSGTNRPCSCKNK